MSNLVAPLLDMLRKMLQNNEPHEKILAFLDNACKDIYASSIHQDILSCKACGLKECNHTSFIGNIHSEVMFIGEAPGEHEEKQGEPFVGPGASPMNITSL